MFIWHSERLIFCEFRIEGLRIKMYEQRHPYLFAGPQSQSFIIASLVPFRKVPPRWHLNFHATIDTCSRTVSFSSRINKRKRDSRNIIFRFFSQTEAVASSIPGCDLLIELFVDTSGRLLFDCAHNTKEFNRVISFLFKWYETTKYIFYQSKSKQWPA